MHTLIIDNLFRGAPILLVTVTSNHLWCVVHTYYILYAHNWVTNDERGIVYRTWSPLGGCEVCTIYEHTNIRTSLIGGWREGRGWQLCAVVTVFFVIVSHLPPIQVYAHMIPLVFVSEWTITHLSTTVKHPKYCKESPHHDCDYSNSFRST